ncbi:MAG: SDR family NAD(P)-dependent oxidoreductase [Pseudomonadota bacterium]
MNNALIIGGSGGIGAALVAELESRGVAVTSLSRSGDGLDVTDEARVAEVLGGLEGSFDLIFVASGALQIGDFGPEKALKQLDPEAMMAQFAVNAIGPAMVLKHGLRLLPREGRAVFAALSARVGSIGDNRLGGWYSYRAAKAAVNQLIHSAAIEVARTHKEAICVALHPGTVATPFTAQFVKPEKATPPADTARQLIDVVEGLTPDDTGLFFDYAAKPIPW